MSSLRRNDEVGRDGDSMSTQNEERVTKDRRLKMSRLCDQVPQYPCSLLPG